MRFNELNLNKDILDAIKDLGFEYSTVAGMTISLADINVAPNKQKFIDEKIIFKGSKELYGFEKQRILDQIKEDRLLADALIRKMRNQ